jgi:phosphoribosylamine--glycine ligase
MRVLVLGAGGREHALLWRLSMSPLVAKLWCAPGNAGTAEIAENLPIKADDVEALAAFAVEHGVDLVVPGAEASLVAGIADRLAARGIRCCGPSAAAARLEGSKTFTKEIAAEAAIPTAAWESFDDPAAARAYLRRQGVPIVIKADGLAAGKGVVVATSLAEAEAAITDFMEKGTLGGAGARLVIEECLVGEEVSLFALCDGETAIFLGAAQDHKRVGDGDKGPNTGGMGAYSPPPVLSADLQNAAMARIVRPALAALARRGTPFRGILFAGLMLTRDGPKLIEFNVRFGDPECQVLLPRLHSDLLPALLAACDGDLAGVDLRWREEAAITVVLAARGYPAKPVTGGEIRGLEAAGAVPGVRIFHAGTARAADGRLIAAGGRVLSVTATANTLRAARDAAYQAIARLDFADGFCRSDIGWRALAGSG